MEKLGTYKGVTVYALSRQEYVEDRYYEDKFYYYIITNDTVTHRGKYWCKLIHSNQWVGIVSNDYTKVDDNMTPTVYYIGRTEYVEAARKVAAPAKKVGSAPAAEPLKGMVNFDVDAFLKSEQSVDVYLREMEKKKYE